MDSLKQHADSLLQEENELANSTVYQSSSQKFMSTIMSSGTMEDRISALTLAIQESPLHNVKAFESLAGLGKKKSRGQALMALAALKDLLGQGVVLPADRKLRYFKDQPMLWASLQGQRSWSAGDPLPNGVEEAHLISWAYEDWLKKSYFDIIKTLETWAGDEIEYSRARSLNFVFELLKDKPEQEENLLRLLVNKLGDKAKKVSSRASYLLLQLQEAHPNMRATVVKAIESDVLFRPGQNLSAKYYACITLNQTVLSTKETELAQKLLEMYFGVFKALLKADSNHHASKQGEGKLNRKAIQRMKDQEAIQVAEEQSKEKMIAQVLTGINRAYPFADMGSAAFDAQLDTLYRVTHSANFNTSIQALVLIQMITQTNNATTDRYYRTLYESLLDPRLASSSKHILYLNLLHRSLKADLNIKRVQAFVKRILQILSIHEAPFICSALYLISEIIKVFPSIASMLSEPENIEEDEERFVDVAEDGTTQDLQTQSNLASYDPKKRDPLFTNAERSCLWELIPFQAHFHPSVALFAQRLLLGQKMPEKPDPTLHTLIHFLDRFIYKNSKAKNTVRGNSIMQPLAITNGADMLISERTGASMEAPLNKEAFWSKSLKDVAVDEVFFHQYFAHSGVRQKKVKKDKRAVEEDDDVDEEQEQEIWKALVDSRPDIEGDDDGDGFSDMEELMAEDDSANSESSEEGDLEALSDVEGFDSDIDLAGESGDEGDINLESDDDAMIDSDEELPANIKLPLSKGSDKKEKGVKLKNLPVFASAEDYAALIGDDEDY
jgi:ribosome biogenesis protein MAK21